MRDTLEYIDAYFNHELEDSEEKEFAFRCTADNQFAKEVAFHVAARAEVRQLLVQQKQEWKPDDVKMAAANTPVKKLLSSWITYAAAACVIAIIALVSIFHTPSANQMAAQYINENYTLLGHTMDASRDNVQSGISAYEDKNFERAAQLFDGVATVDSTNSDALKYAGLAYLQMNRYSEALHRFQQLSSLTNLQFNSGDMLQAVTLLQRNEVGDKEKAKTFLQKVVNENEEGAAKAKAMLDKW